MKTYISLLRGINVSGKNIVKMDVLKHIFITLSFTNVKTYIQSGNVIFSTNESINEKLISKQIETEIKTTLNLDISILIFEKTEFNTIIKLLPFSEFEEKNIYLTFLNSKTKITNYEKILDKKSESERIQILEKVIYLDCPNGYGKTKLSNNFIEKQLNILCTTRNLKTCKKIIELCDN